MDRKRRKTKDSAVEGGSKSNAHPMEFSEDSEEDEVIDDCPQHSPINLIVELETLNRKKDVVCLILSYLLSTPSTKRDTKVGSWMFWRLITKLMSHLVVPLEKLNIAFGDHWWNSKNIQKIVYRCGSLHRFDPPGVGLGIRLEDHLLSWELFRWNVGEVLHSSSIQCFVIHLLKQCCGHLLATILMARGLKGVNDVRIWEYASHILGLQPISQTEDRILFNALTFLRRGLGSADQCLKHCASYLESSGTNKIDLIGRWVRGTLVGTLEEGERLLEILSMPSCWRVLRREIQSECGLKSM
ncbi:hypothetical protein CK203_093331 [Vitis vinifera]|uniref:Uncharacterized protein n=1 Tax=Vitis vinifera TaxID=29760 RepID=A0A438E2X4_VITVI|nr:hypothetical protein CK203_093331 [Vitis vinifera]